MKCKIFILLFLLFSLNIYGKNYYYIDYYPDIEPVKNFFIKLKNRINDNNINFFIVKDKKVFNSSKEILDALQSNIIQLALLPAWVINNNFNNVFKNIYYNDYKNISLNLMIPYREKLLKYGLFLLDIFYGGKFNIFSKFRLDRTKNFSNAILGSLFKLENRKKFYKILPIDDTTNVKSLVDNGIMNCVLLTSIQFFTFNLINSDLSYKNNLNGIYNYYIIVANNVFWQNLNYSTKSFLWDFILSNKNFFQTNFSKFNIYVENSINQKLLILNLGNIIH